MNTLISVWRFTDKQKTYGYRVMRVFPYTSNTSTLYNDAGFNMRLKYRLSASAISNFTLMKTIVKKMRGCIITDRQFSLYLFSTITSLRIRMQE